MGIPTCVSIFQSKYLSGETNNRDGKYPIFFMSTLENDFNFCVMFSESSCTDKEPFHVKGKGQCGI